MGGLGAYYCLWMTWILSGRCPYFSSTKESQILYLLFSYHERLYKGIYLEGAN